VKKFNDYFMNLLWTGPGLPDEKFVHPMRSGLPDEVPVFFTHADLTPTNMILSSSPSGHKSIAAIIDWHQSGWYPAYWEACKSLSNADPVSTWGKGLPAVFAPHGEIPRTFSWMISVGVAI
jgi:Phosphotransferase enzyme family